MKKRKFSKAWKSSKKPGKQRKYIFNSPLHIKRRLLSARLSKENSKKYNKKTLTVRTGDKVKIVRGQFRGKSGKVERVDIRKSKVYVTGIEFLKKDGSKTLYPIDPSNTIIQEIYTDDKKRMKRMQSTGSKRG